MSRQASALAVVEPSISASTGHWSGYVLELARAAQCREQRFVLVCEGDVAGGLGADLRDAGAVVLARTGRARLRPMFAASCGLDRIFRVLHRRWPRSKYPYQFLLLARGLSEADNVRRARRAVTASGTVVVTTASEALAGMVGLLSGSSHVRVVHDVYSWHSPLIKLLRRVCHHGLSRVRIVCATEGIRRELVIREPTAVIQVRTFALAGRPGQAGSAPVMRRLRVVGLFGAWYRWKDANTIVAGIRLCLQFSTHIQFIIAGSQLPGVDALLADIPPGTVRVVERALEEEELRALYAECDAVVVCRKPGTVLESGLVMDAARYGVHLVCSDHDPALTNLVRAEKWVSLFTAGDPAALAGALGRLASMLVVPLPDEGAEGRLGMESAEAALDFYADLNSIDPNAAESVS